jgi:PEP-CTERM motif
MGWLRPGVACLVKPTEIVAMRRHLRDILAAAAATAACASAQATASAMYVFSGPGTDPGPAATGNEIAFVELVAGFVDGRSANPFVTIKGDGVRLSTDGGSFADGLTQSGRLYVHAEAASAPFDAVYSSGFTVYAFAAVDASPLSPIPEPATYALLLSGLGVLGLKARRRTHR